MLTKRIIPCIDVDLAEADADAALATSIFHFGGYSNREVKEHLDERGIPVPL